MPSPDQISAIAAELLPSARAAFLAAASSTHPRVRLVSVTIAKEYVVMVDNFNYPEKSYDNDCVANIFAQTIAGTDCNIQHIEVDRTVTSKP